MPKYTQPDYNDAGQSGSAYPLFLDAGMKVLSRMGAAYNPCAEDNPTALKVVIQAGAMFINGVLVANADQIITLATAHATLPRIDRVVIDALTGVASKVDGTPNAVPVAPAIPVGKLPVAQVLVDAAMTVVTDSKITDERAPLVPAYADAFLIMNTFPSYTSGISSKISWGTEVRDTGGLFDPGQPTRFTAPSWAKEAKCNFQIAWSNATTGSRHYELQKNNSGSGAWDGKVIEFVTPGMSTVYYMRGESAWLPVVGGDYFELSVGQASGGNLGLTGSGVNWFNFEVRG